MGDIDFDELDKAVNSLMGGVPREDDAPKQKTLSINDTLKPGEKPAYAKLEAVAKTIGNEATSVGEYKMNVAELKVDGQQLATPILPVVPESVSVDTPPRESVPRPNTGRFMDVVHPSSDMKIASQGTSGIRVPERTAPDVPATPNVAASTSASVTENVPQPAPAALPDLTPLPADTPEPTPPAEPEGKSDSAPLTPFLPDAKVEKRPLGEPIVPKPVESESAALPEAADSETDEEIIPEELTPADKSALEVSKSTFDNKELSDTEKMKDGQKPLNPEDFAAMPTEEDQKLSSIEAQSVDDALPLTEESVRKVESGDTGNVISNGSITQQYQEQPANAEPTAEAEEKGGIYDVQDYHQPLAHPAKQKSGWGTVIIIFVVILICVIAAGATYYFLAMHG